ncbi:hypothetical protein FGG36_gp38 [Mycobacterium phage Jeffabunny]|uniref:Uncharacterized protein n=7 Tax=Gladiatorvirus TaxID=2948726 RepID=A0A1C9LYX0_9CAUD|nr:hypothetical protein X820_gp048 [Mycobacterium phage CloudWang3]YP_008858490.1 hypothetical protein X828_gp048 [Mycobacterium phage Artemis2UCLA]YP_008859173.1 hypothetical protein X821_gp047 [Mycobacterium phage Zaka]YP_009014555.1 hypothetical protein CL99_gp048 [Mycobacterium phage Blue7]YP_009635557.1 hypothetical protein FGG54_gp45 [Mycobacterium phage Gladiator]YP_009638237.1 hypothetical protein FGG36_gp38 [Mycobacterium phage Jeffabunny]YP_010061390.1 hypothetical protein KIP56_gp0
MKYGVRYPKSGVHECMYGKRQAEQIWFLALRNGIAAVVVTDSGNGWEPS